MIDLDDVTRCGPATRCAACSTVDGDLVVHTATTPVGVICLPLCPPCSGAGELPRLGMAQAVVMSLNHCGHLGITADQMGDAMTATRHTIRHYGDDEGERA